MSNDPGAGVRPDPLAPLRSARAVVAAMLDDLNAVIPDPPRPSGKASMSDGNGGKLPGYTWRPCEGWAIQVQRREPGQRPDPFVYIVLPVQVWASDVNCVTSAEARQIAGTLIAAAQYAEADIVPLYDPNVDPS